MATSSYMGKNFKTYIEEIPLSHIRYELPQPRKNLKFDKENQEDGDKKEQDKVKRLLLSLDEDGLGRAISVVKISKDSYQILDGHRRYKCAQQLGWETIRCEVHEPFADKGDMEKLRWNLQTNIDPWKPLERSTELQRIREEKKLKTNKELAAYLHYSENLISSSQKLQKNYKEWEGVMKEYDLSQAYQVEFMRLQPKIREIRDMSESDVIQNIFYRVQHRTIRSAKDFRKLSSVFLRAQANEAEIYQFLKNMDMPVDDLYKNVERSGYAADAEKISKHILEKLNTGEKFSKTEEAASRKLFDVLKKKFSS